MTTPDYARKAELLGRKTPYGRIAAIFPASWPAVGGPLGEEYYMMVDDGSVSLMPASSVEILEVEP